MQQRAGGIDEEARHVMAHVAYLLEQMAHTVWGSKRWVLGVDQLWFQ